MQQKNLVDYYNKNTRKFLFFQRDKAHHNIHQALWAKPRFTPHEAINFSNELIAQQIEKYALDKNRSQLHVLDLGCGVGSTVFYLADKTTINSNFWGISISSVQVEIARKKALNRDLFSKCQFIENDFHALSDDIPTADLIYSIEAFVHSPNPSKYLEQVSQKLHSGGKLIIIDDFLSDKLSHDSPTRKDQKLIADFKYGWVLGPLNTSAQISKMAKSQRLVLVEEKDLTHFLKFRFRDWLIQIFMNFIPKSTKNNYLKSLVGGNARQLCIQKKLIQYKMIVFEKR